MRVVRVVEWVTSDRRRTVVAAVLAVVLLSGTAVALAVALTGRQPAAVAGARPGATSTGALAPAATAVPPSPGASATTVPASATVPVSGPGGGSGTTPVESRAPGRVTRVITWLQEFAPESGGHVGAGTISLYRSLTDGDCQGVLDSGYDFEIGADPALERATAALYRGAAAACLAAFHGLTSRWATATADLDTASGVAASRLTCYDRPLLAMLRTLVQAHEANPDVVLRQGNGPGGLVPCPRLLSLAPDHGPVEGGYEVVATGEHLPPTVRIELDGMATVVGQSDAAGTRAVFTMPPADPAWLELADGKPLQVQTEDWPLEGNVEFTYDTPPAGGGG